MIRVVNKHYHKPTNNDVYIGRGSVLGNPFSHKTGTKAEHTVDSRETAIQWYKERLIGKLTAYKDEAVINEMNRIYILAKRGDVNLVCYCHPHACHGDVIKRVIEEKLRRLDITQAIRMLDI